MTNRPNNWHEKHIEKRTFSERLADKVAGGMGSWAFIIVQTLAVMVWMGLNVLGIIQHWDPYPFILLNLLFSTQAAYAAPIIMMSQNRQADRDRHQAQADYETNVAAKEEIEQLMQTLARLEEDKLDKIIEWMAVLLRSEILRREENGKNSVQPPKRALR